MKSESLLARVLTALALSALFLSVPAPAQEPDAADDRITLTMRDVELAEVMEMLSLQNRANILLADGVDGSVSFSLYDVELSEAITAIANAAGFVVERRLGSYFIVPADQTGRYGDSGFTQVRSFAIRYADVSQLGSSLTPYLSAYGQLTAIPERSLLVVEDQPAFLNRIAGLVSELDRRPQQILIEAKILEVTLSDEDSYGIDWRKFFTSEGQTQVLGIQGLGGPGTSGSTGFFIDYLTADYEVLLNALEVRGRLRTLSAPKLLAVENQEASVVIGDRRGYLVTTTINQVTTESVEFLESGVILRVTPSVDDEGQIMLDVHPEVSNGTVDVNGIPSQTTTEVTTRLIIPNGQTVFLGGLLKHTASEDTQRVPVVGRLPVLRRIFASKLETNVNTETIVLISPRIVDDTVARFNARQWEQVHRTERAFEQKSDRIEAEVEEFFEESSRRESRRP